MNRILGVLLGGLAMGCNGFDDLGGPGAGGSGGSAADTSTSTTSSADAATGTSSTGKGSTSTVTSSSTGTPITPSQVHVVDTDGVPAAGVVVFANDVEGNLSGDATTDAQGNATLEVEAGGSIHVAREAPAFSDGELYYERVILSQFSLEEGSDVTFRVVKAGETHDDSSPNQPMDLMLYSSQCYGGQCTGSDRQVYSFSCASQTASTYGYRNDTMYRGCAGEDVFGAYALHYDNDVLIGEGMLTDLPLQPGPQVHYTINATPVSYATSRFILSDAPSDHGLTVYVVGRTGRMQWSEMKAMTGVSQIKLETYVPRIFDHYDVVFLAEDANAESGYARWTKYDQAPSGMSITASEIARVRIAAYDKSDAQHPEVTVDFDAGSKGDYVRAALEWSGVDRTIVWQGFAPASANMKLRVPSLPQAVADWVIQPGESLSSLNVRNYDTDVSATPLDATKMDLDEVGYMMTYAAAP